MKFECIRGITEEVAWILTWGIERKRDQYEKAKKDYEWDREKYSNARSLRDACADMLNDLIENEEITEIVKQQLFCEVEEKKEAYETAKKKYKEVYAEYRIAETEYAACRWLFHDITGYFYDDVEESIPGKWKCIAPSTPASSLSETAKKNLIWKAGKELDWFEKQKKNYLYLKKCIINDGYKDLKYLSIKKDSYDGARLTYAVCHDLFQKITGTSYEEIEENIPSDWRYSWSKDHEEEEKYEWRI